MFYLNTNVSAIQFQKVINSEPYVDKSGLIDPLNKLIGTANCYVCITRPRRFGKTINAHMLGAYYTKGQNNKNMFDSLIISNKPSYEKHLNLHNVIFIDFSVLPANCSSYESYIEYIQYKILTDIQQTYGITPYENLSVSDLLTATGDSFIFILDEWDSVFYRKFMSSTDKNNYLLFLRDLLKDKPYVELAYMTGILPIAKYSSGSELNIFQEYNFMNDHVYENYFGFQENEVKVLCKKQTKITYEELVSWYDGYYMSDGSHLFIPRSVNCALRDGVCLNYWTETGPMNEIADCIEHNIDEVREDVVKMISGIPVEAELMGYSASEQQLNTRDEILSAMVVFGFLSYHDRVLRIPNRELMEKHQRVLSRNSMGEVKKIVDQSKEMLAATLQQNTQKVASILESVHDREIPFLKYNDENSLSCVITLCYLYARNEYYIEREFATGKGFCDYIFIPKRKGKTGIILELKVGHSPQEALKQIKDKNYIQKLDMCKDVLLVGINYSTEKHHECKIEQVFLQYR